MIYLITLIVFLLDFLTKWLVVSNLPFAQATPVFTHFNLFFVMNNGISFSFLRANSIASTWGLILLALIICGGIVYFIQKEKDKTSKIALSMILGGALGNIWDRIHYGAVVDFLDFYMDSHHFPAFNIADSFICIGVGLLLIKMYQKEKK